MTAYETRIADVDAAAAEDVSPISMLAFLAELAAANAVGIVVVGIVLQLLA